LVGGLLFGVPGLALGLSALAARIFGLALPMSWDDGPIHQATSGELWFLMVFSLPFTGVGIWCALHWRNAVTILTKHGVEGRNTWGKTIFSADWADLTSLKRKRDGAGYYDYVVSAGRRTFTLAAGNKDLHEEIEKRLPLETT
jgi:hypothetical protein